MGSCHRQEIFLTFLYVVNILFYCFEDGGLGYTTQLKYSSLLEVIFTIVSLITRESSWTSNKHENVYFADRPRHKARFTSTRETRNELKRVLQKPAREMHEPIERLGSTRNQYGDRLLGLVRV